MQLFAFSCSLLLCLLTLSWQNTMKSMSNTPPDYSTLIKKAIEEGDLKMLRAMKQDLNNYKINNTSPLIYAAAKGCPDSVKWLLDNGANPNETDSVGKTPLHIAAQEGRSDNIYVLFAWHAEHKKKYDTELRDNIGLTPLHYASSKGGSRTVQALLDHHACIESKLNPLHLTPCHLAALSGNKKTLLCLLENKADLNTQAILGLTSLHVAAATYCQPAIKFLLEHKADPSLTTTFDPLNENHRMLVNLPAAKHSTLLAFTKKAEKEALFDFTPQELAKLVMQTKD